MKVKIIIISLIIITIGFKIFFSIPAVNEAIYIYKKYQPVENVLQEISSKEYSEDYNCVQFSQDAVKALAEKNIKAIEITGKNQKGYHRWISIEIEPINGEILKPNEYEALMLSKNK